MCRLCSEVCFGLWNTIDWISFLCSQVTSFVIVPLEMLSGTQVVVSRSQGMCVEHVAVKNTISKIV